MILGHLEEGLNKWQGIAGLFDRRLSDRQAVRRYMASSKRKPARRLVKLTQAVHTAVFAPTGVGKGVSCVVPFLLSNPDSCVVVDFKGELATITAEARRKMGHKVVLLDPYKVVTQTPDTFNPLDFIDADSDLAIDDCNDLANALVVRKGTEHEPQWNDNAEKWIGTMAAFLVHLRSDVSLENLKMLLANPAYREGAIKKMAESDAWGGILSRKGHELTNFVDRELGSVLTTANRHLNFLDTPAISESTKKSSFDPADLFSRKTTVYLILPPDRMRAQAGVLRMWIGAMFRACVRNGAQEDKLVHFILDEAASLGRMEAVNDAIDKGRGYGVRLQLYWQSLGQLKTSFPEDNGQTLLSNTTQVLFGVNDLETAKYVSERLGEQTSIVEDFSSGTSESRSPSQQGGGSTSYSSNKGRSWKQVGQRLLKPEQILSQLDPRIAITFAPGVPPIWTRLIRYYEGDLNESHGIKPVKAAIDAVCFFVAAALCAAIFTAAVLKGVH